MNKIMTFFTAPITALFYPPVYRDAAKSSAGRGVLYSLYLAGISTAFVMIALSVTVMPQVDAFVDWAKSSMPAMVWTPQGLSLENGQTSATLTHPKFGTIVIFDMTKTSVTEADMGKAYVLVTAKKVFLKRAPGQIEERDITQAAVQSRQQLPSRVRINGDVLGKVYQNVKKAMVFLFPFLTLVFSFMFFLTTNLFYSLAGLLFNLVRAEKLGYGAIFNLTCFATGAAFTLTWLRVLTPFQTWSFPFVLNVLVNLGFMFFAFKVTDKKKEAV